MEELPLEDEGSGSTGDSFGGSSRTLTSSSDGGSILTSSGIKGNLNIRENLIPVKQELRIHFIFMRIRIPDPDPGCDNFMNHSEIIKFLIFSGIL